MTDKKPTCNSHQECPTFLSSARKWDIDFLVLLTFWVIYQATPSEWRINKESAAHMKLMVRCRLPHSSKKNWRTPTECYRMKTSYQYYYFLTFPETSTNCCPPFNWPVIGSASSTPSNKYGWLQHWNTAFEETIAICSEVTIYSLKMCVKPVLADFRFQW